MNKGRAWSVPAAVLTGALLAGGCAPEGISSQGEEIERLYNFFMVAAAGVFIIVSGLIVWSLVRYRRRDDELPKQVHGNNRLELLWTILPTILVLVLFQQTIAAQDQVTAEAGQPDVTIDAIAFQWQWQFVHLGPDGSPLAQELGSADQPAELVVPAGRTVRVRLQSRDVVHAFYIPRTLYKRQAIPGRVNEFDMFFERPGSYQSFCAFYCGLAHARMTFTTTVVPEQEYQRWLTEQQAASQATGGR